jgi:uncharacterized protein Smg (DUF494 family)
LIRNDNQSAPITSGRILEIITYLLGQMKDRKDLADVNTRELTERGYSQAEISTAFSWLLDKLALASIQADLFRTESSRTDNKAIRDQYRPFHEFENGLMSVEACGYLLQLREFGLLSDIEMEAIIDRIWFFGGSNIDLTSIQEISAQVIFDFNDSARTGSRMMLRSTDTIH